MYFQQDTILRLIEQLGAAYRELMRRLDDWQAEGELEKVYRRLCGLDRKSVKGLSVDALVDTLTEERRLAASELLLMESERFAHRYDNDELAAQRLRALAVLTSIQDETIAALRWQRAREVFEQCQAYCLPPEAAAVVRFLLRGGAYAAAEDVLFLQLAAFGPTMDIRALVLAGKELYAALASRTDDQLSAGGLPRAEADEGLRSLTAWELTHVTLAHEEHA